MESVNLEMDDLFENEAMDDDDIGAVSALPDLPDYREDDGEGDGEGGEQDNEDAENTEVLAKLKDLSKGAAKKVIRKPQPKLDATRLTGERGIPILPKVFEKVKFKGKGYEAQDLALLMRNLEHWGHRLFPKMPFDEVIERVERLGSKREVQTCIKKMRLDMPILNDDFVGSDKEDDVIRQENDLLPQGRTVQDMEDEWDDLMREAEESQADQTPLSPSHIAPGPSRDTPGPSHDTPGPSQNMPVLRYDTPGPADSQLSTPAPQKTNTDSPFTPDQLERMERNKQIAREKRLAKMGIKSPATPLTKPLPSSTQPSQPSTQGILNERVTSPVKTTGSPANKNSKSRRAKPLRVESDDESEPEVAGSEENHLESDSEEMSEVIKSQNDRVVITRHQDAQNWDTEPSVSGTSESNTEHSESIGSAALKVGSNEMTHLEDKISANSKLKTFSKVAENGLSSHDTDELEIRVNEKFKESSSAVNGVIESEEMSEVVPNQDAGKVVRDKNVPKTQPDSFEPVEEMSEVIERQDFKVDSLDSNKENVSIFVNGVNKTDRINAEDDGCISDKPKGVLNDDIDMNGAKKAVVNGTDELNEEELMETLDS